MSYLTNYSKLGEKIAPSNETAAVIKKNIKLNATAEASSIPAYVCA